MMIGLIIKEKLCFADGTLVNPSYNDPNKKAWERNNNMVLDGC